MGSPVTVLVADDHPLYREGIARAIEQRPDLRLVGAVADGQEALDRIRALTPDVAVLDVRMPVFDGVEVLTALRAEQRPTRIVLLSAFTDREIVVAAVAAGVDGYLSKDADRTEICDAVAAVARGEARLDPALQAGLMDEIRRRRTQGPPARLTDREAEVLRFIAEGMSAPAIAERLELSTATVKTHLSNLYEKLGVSDRAAAVAEAMRRDLLV
jgi:two-component system, NarL family, nitrate/nitrite response regulator NarL